MKRLLKNNRGMSLMEILVALSLLMIIIVGTTPVMLQAYNGLYTAGEYTQNVYNAKTEVEDQLATRSSVRNYPSGFKVNFEGLGEVATVNAKRAVSSLKNSLETLFANARVRIYISSGSIVDDNQSNHSITLQTVNLEFASKDDISVDGTAPSKDGKKIGITAYLPQKNASNGTAASVYTENRKATVTIVDDTTVPAAGRIGINISSDSYPIDFTTSPIKIVVSYLDENNKPKSAHTYLTIKTPTIIIAGETNNNVQYYTTAGVQEIKDSNGNVTQRKFDVEARRMNIGYLEKDDATRSNELGAASTQAVPANTVFKSVNWITEFARTTGGTNNEDIEYASSSYEPEYYVLTGTNGVIYRTYTFEEQNNIKGKVKLDTGKSATALGLNELSLNTVTGANQLGADVMSLNDTYIILDDRASTVVYPAVWGGDFSHVFGYSSYSEFIDYKDAYGEDVKTWYTEDGNSGKGQKGFYSNLANFGYYYSGYGMNFDKDKSGMGKRYTRNSRKISYILTETTDALRVGGLLEETGHYDRGVNRIWERPLDWNHDGTLTQQFVDSDDYGFTFDGFHDGFDFFYYYKDANHDGVKDESFPRSVLLDPGASDERFNNNQMKQLPIYFANNNHNDRPDQGFAQLRIKAMTTLEPQYIFNRWVSKGENSDEKDTDVRFAYDNAENKSKIVVTDAVYIPATDTTEAQVFYVGTVETYALLHQVDNIDGKAQRVRNNGSDNTGAVTTYWVMGNSNEENTTIYKYSAPIKSTGNSTDFGHTYNRYIMQYGAFPHLSETDEKVTAIKANENKSHEFFVTRIAEDNETDGRTVRSNLFSDVQFTMGYTSNREIVYSKIVYGINQSGTLQEAYKSYEPLYFISHYNGDEFHVPNGYYNKTADPNQETKDYLNTMANDYYNVWFPGEMYNLTKVATKDNVTVAVGYAVSGSTYSWAKDGNGSYVSTGLGSIYNDGVISGMVLGKDTSFNSLLYYKDGTNFDSTYLSSTSPIKDANGNYGTHARDSVQFTCVDISVVVSGDKTYYYAYYADNKGRIYRSLVATRGKDAAAATMVNYISDKSSSPGIENVSYMEEQTFVVGEWTMKGSNYFEKINTIAAHDDLIVITGKSKSNTTWKLNILVGVIDKENPTAAPTWKLLTWGYDNFVVHDALIRDGYLYLVGENSTSPCGFILAVPLDTLRSADSNTSISGIFKDNSGDHQLKFYAIAGKE